MPKQKPIKVHSSKLMKSANNPAPKFIKNALTTNTSKSFGSMSSTSSSSSSMGSASNVNQRNNNKINHNQSTLPSSSSSSNTNNNFEKNLDELKQRHFQRTDVPTHQHLQTQQNLLAESSLSNSNSNVSNAENKVTFKPSLLAQSNNVIFRPSFLQTQYDSDYNNNNPSGLTSAYDRTATIGAAIVSVTTSMAQIDSLLGDETNIAEPRNNSSSNNNKRDSASLSIANAPKRQNSNVFSTLMNDDDDDENDSSAAKVFTSKYTLRPSIITSYGANDYEI